MGVQVRFNSSSRGRMQFRSSAHLDAAPDNRQIGAEPISPHVVAKERDRLRPLAAILPAPMCDQRPTARRAGAENVGSRRSRRAGWRIRPDSMVADDSHVPRRGQMRPRPMPAHCARLVRRGDPGPDVRLVQDRHKQGGAEFGTLYPWSYRRVAFPPQHAPRARCRRRVAVSASRLRATTWASA